MFKKLFRKKATEEQLEEFSLFKEKALAEVLGEMHNMVGHAVIPFNVGGAVDMYYFPQAIEGTAFATMELIENENKGPKPNKHGMYELLAFTRHKIQNLLDESNQFNQIERRICGIFTDIGNYSYQAKLEPGDTCEIPRDDEDNICLIFDEYNNGVGFRINGKGYGLLVCMEVFRSEMLYAMEHGSASLLEKLKQHGYYPYSDLDRNPVV